MSQTDTVFFQLLKRLGESMQFSLLDTYCKQHDEMLITFSS